MFWRSWSRFGWVLAAAGLLAAMAMPAASRQPRAYGKQLVAQYHLPAKTIARYAALAAGTAGDEVRREDSLFADRSPWVGPEQRAGVGSNPYILVLTVSGVAKVAGDIHSKWQAGWDVREPGLGSRELVMALSGIARTGVAAGERVSLTANSGPVSFRGERRVAPMLGVVQTHNLDVDEVFLQVWSGSAPMAWPETSLSPRALLALGASALLLWWGLGRWPPRARSTVVQDVQVQDLPGEGHAARDAVEPEPASVARQVPVARPTGPGHKAWVIDALQQVLTRGLAVETVLDEARAHKGRGAGTHRTAAT